MDSHYTPVCWRGIACCCQDNYQRHATLLVYLNDVDRGGVTRPFSSPGNISWNCLGLKRPHGIMFTAFSVGPGSSPFRHGFLYTGFLTCISKSSHGVAKGWRAPASCSVEPRGRGKQMHAESDHASQLLVPHYPDPA